VKIVLSENTDLKDDQRFKWGEEQQSAFDLLKHATTAAPILVLPDMSLPRSYTILPELW
jgi:hypothetical protein